jgi:cyclopropane-fatty-acyl-phospholipid synthase
MITGSQVSAGASAQAIRFHYDLSNEFYRLWLDPTLTYSCAFWDGAADELEAAQQRKLAFMADHANARGAARVLDIGCGWGSMLHHLVADCGVGRAIGLTLSEQQYSWLNRCDDPRIAVRLEPWRSHQPEAPYDAIISIGAFEHFVQPGLEPGQKLAAYGAFFEACAGWLRPGGRLCLQSICLTDGSVAVSDFIARHVFPESDLPTLVEICRAAQDAFEVILVRNDRAHYERTCREWLNRLKDHRSEASDLVGADVVRHYEKYLSFCCLGFRSGSAGLLRIVLERR